MPSSRYATDAARWAAVRDRNPDAEGHFVTAVKTTKIFCRPTCKARLARRSNVEFYDTGAEAQAAGFRACKRCKPELEKFVPEADQSIEKVRQMLEKLPANAPLPKLESMAADAGLTKYHFHRCFKRATGLTPREYALSRRRSRQTEPIQAPVNVVDESNISTPSLVCDAAPQTGASATPDALQTPDFAFDDWLIAGPLDSALFDEYAYPMDYIDGQGYPLIPSPRPVDAGKDVPQLPLTFPVHYSAVDTTHGVLFMAFEEGQICKLELISTTVEAMASLERSFPKPYYVLTPVEELPDEQRQTVQQQVRAVVEALENPLGRAMPQTPFPMTWHDGAVQ